MSYLSGSDGRIKIENYTARVREAWSMVSL